MTRGGGGGGNGGGGGVDDYARGPPWVFTGKAIYQLHLVRADVARRFVPPDLRLVEAFGYTLGGLYLAQYDSSPADRFDELVVLAGIVWNPPTSCAWAARVLVNSQPARNHGIMLRVATDESVLSQHVGLPSSLASFTKTVERMPNTPRWLQMPLLRSSRNRKEIASSKIRESLVVEDTEGAEPSHPLCRITLPTADERSSWSGLRIRMSLPSFSGRTQSRPELLKYSCSLHCGVRVVKPAVVALPDEAAPHTQGFHLRSPMLARPSRADLQTILQGKPVFAIAFDHLYMEVAAPLVTKATATSRREHLAVAKKHLEAEPVPVS